MPSLLDTQTNSLSSTEVSVGSIETYTEGSDTTSTQLNDLNTQESADLQLSSSDIWLATSNELDLAPDGNLLSTNISNSNILYEPTAEIAAQGVTYDSSPTLSTLATATTQTDLGTNTWDQTSTLPTGNYSLKTDDSLASSNPTLSTSTTSTSFSSGSSGPLYLASTDTPAIGSPFLLTGSGSESSKLSSNGSPTSTSDSDRPTSTNTSTDTTKTPDISTTIGTNPPPTSDSPSDGISTSPSATPSATTTTTSPGQNPTKLGSDDPVAVPFEMHSSIGLLMISLVIAKRMLNRQKAEKLVRIG